MESACCCEATGQAGTCRLLLARALSFMSVLLHNLRTHETAFMCGCPVSINHHSYYSHALPVDSSHTKGTANERHV